MPPGALTRDFGSQSQRGMDRKIILKQGFADFFNRQEGIPKNC